MAKAKPETEQETDGPVVLSRAAFLNGSLALEKRRVPLPEKGGYVTLSVLSASRRDLWEASTLKRTPQAVSTDYTDYRAKAIALSLWDESKNDWMCTLDDVPTIGAMPAPIIARLFDAFVALNAVKADDLEELEAALKNGRSAAS